MAPWVRSILSVLAGYVTVAVLVIAFTAALNHVLRLDNDRPTPLYVVLNLLFSYAIAALGAYLTARLAGRAPLAHGAALATIMLILSALTLLKGIGGQGTVYVIALSLGGPVFAVVGAYVRARQIRDYEY